MAFPKFGIFEKGEAISIILENVCEYLFQGTYIRAKNDPLIMNRVFTAYPKNYKDIVGTASFDEEGYNDKLARIRLYQKVRKVISSFASELKAYFLEKKKGVDAAYLKNVNSLTASKKTRNCRKYFFNHISYDVDEENKIVRAYFGENMRLSRIKFVKMAKEVSTIGVFSSVRTFYCADTFIRDELLSRTYIGIAKYNKEEETELFSVKKGKEIAKADLIRRYMTFETKVAKDNYNAFCRDIDTVIKRIDKLL